MFVVERSSTGADILYLIVPGGKECLVVRLLCGREDVPASDRFLLRLVVKALEREDIVDYRLELRKSNSGSMRKKGSCPTDLV